MKLVTQVTIITILTVFSVVVIAVILADTPESSVSVIDNSSNGQPQREKYQAPEWVTNQRGQRCIKQGTVVTCG